MPKELGGVAIRDMGKMNLACIMKLGWAIKMQEENLLCQVLRGKYARGNSNLDTLVVRNSDSPL
jgi:hypothetical protein